MKQNIYSEKLLKKITKLNLTTEKKVDIEQIEKAIYCAKKYHADQKRDSGEPFYSHPLAVAEMVADYCFKTDVLVTAILHDIVEDTEVTAEMVKGWFGDKVANDVEGLTRVKTYGKITSAELVEKLYLQKNRDTLLIKLCDRVHNLQTINVKSYAKQRKISMETVNIFLLLAQYIETPKLEKRLIQLCVDILITSISKKQEYVFEDNFRIPSLIIQNDVILKNTLSLLEA